MGVTLDTQGVATSKVIFTNLTSGGIQISATNASKAVVIDCANFENGYSNGDVIGIENAGASVNNAKTTITVDTGEGLQDTTLDCAAASTGSNLSM